MKRFIKYFSIFFAAHAIVGGLVIGVDYFFGGHPPLFGYFLGFLDYPIFKIGQQLDIQSASIFMPLFVALAVGSFFWGLIGLIVGVLVQSLKKMSAK